MTIYNFEIRLKRVIHVSKEHFGSRIESFCWTSATGTDARQAMDFAENRCPGWKAVTWSTK